MAAEFGEVALAGVGRRDSVEGQLRILIVIPECGYKLVAGFQGSR